jgi:hypothetical protein
MIHDSPKVETTNNPPTGEWTDKMWYAHDSGLLFKNKMKQKY